MHSIAWYFGMVRYFVQACPDYCTSVAVGNQTVFLLQIEYEVDRRFYEAAQNQSVWFQMRLTSELVAVGRTTLTTRSALYSGKTADHRPLVTAKYKQAVVNPVTRKSKALSEQFLNKYANYSNTNDGMVPYVIPTAPTDAFSCEFSMRYSDSDINHHVNNTKYIMLCYDCATMAALHGGHLNGFSGDVSSRLAKTVKCSYMSESRPGDLVQAVVWEDSALPDALHFLLSKESKNIFYCFIQFYREMEFVSKL